MDRDHCQPACAPFNTTFCPACGKADRTALKGVRLMGAVGVAHTSNPKIETFFATGDPSVFATPPGRE